MYSTQDNKILEANKTLKGKTIGRDGIKLEILRVDIEFL